MGGYEIGLSASDSSGANAGAGDFNVSDGGGKQTSIGLIAVGAVALLGFIAWLVLRK